MFCFLVVNFGFWRVLAQFKVFSEFFDWSKITRGESEVLIFSSYRRGKWNYEGITGMVSQAYVSISSKKVKSHMEDFERGISIILSTSCRSLDSKTYIDNGYR